MAIEEVFIVYSQLSNSENLTESYDCVFLDQRNAIRYVDSKNKVIRDTPRSSKVTYSFKTLTTEDFLANYLFSSDGRLKL